MEKFLRIIVPFFLFLIILNSKKINSNPLLNINSTLTKNRIDIDKIYGNISSYEKNNKIFSEMKEILKNISYGNELFEEDYNYLNINSENSMKSDESLEHRLTPETLFEFENKISCFNFIPTKSITKDDTGHFVNLLLLICQNTSIVVSDLLGNIYFIYNVEEEINDIITYNQNDINDFYVVTKNYTEIKKFILLQGFFYKSDGMLKNESGSLNVSYDIDDNIINVETYAEDIKREKIEKFSYKLVDTYRQNIKEQRVRIINEYDINFRLSNFTSDTDEYIINIYPVIIKGEKSLIVITNKKSIYKLNDKNFGIISYSEIAPKDIGNFSNILNPVTMTSYYILFNNLEKSFILSKIENISSVINKCELFPENSTEKIKYYYFDQKSRTLYILSNLFYIYLVTPMPILTTNDSYRKPCRIILLCKLNKIIQNNIDIDNYGHFYLSLLNKKLMITRNGIEFEVIDLTRIGEVDDENKLQSKFFSLSNFIDKEIYTEPLITKNNNKYILLYKIGDNSLILFNYHEKSSKIYTSEPQSFNFKVPIILVAFIVILVWNYFKKKNENNGANDIDLKNNFDKFNDNDTDKKTK